MGHIHHKGFHGIDKLLQKHPEVRHLRSWKLKVRSHNLTMQWIVRHYYSFLTEYFIFCCCQITSTLA